MASRTPHRRCPHPPRSRWPHLRRAAAVLRGSMTGRAGGSRPRGGNIFARKPAKTAAWAAEQLEKARNPRHDPLSLFS